MQNQGTQLEAQGTQLDVMMAEMAAMRKEHAQVLANIESPAKPVKQAKPAKRRGNEPKRKASKGNSHYGRAPVGLNASLTDQARKAAIEAEFGSDIWLRWHEGEVIGLFVASSQGMLVKNGKKELDTSLPRCDAAGVGCWTYVAFPDKTDVPKGVDPRKTPHPVIEARCKEMGFTAQDLWSRMNRLGYQYHRKGNAFQTMCDGRPSLGGKKGTRDGAANAFKDVEI